MDLLNAHLSIHYEYLTDCFIVVFHADGINPVGIHAAGSLGDAHFYCSTAFPYLTVDLPEVTYDA